MLDNMRKKITNIEFSNIAKKVHGNKYDYSLVDYKNSHTEIIILCKNHGKFKQKPYSHLNGKGCPTCGGTKSLKIDDFIIRANDIHNNKYDYSKSIYINIKSKIKIICPDHGIFEQVPYNHLRGKGCPICANNIKSNISDFILKANLIYDNKYNYSESEYVNARTKISIICPIHGKYMQRPNDHLNGHGCKQCAYENILKNTSSILETEFLNHLNIDIKHRQISINGYIVDGINKKDKIIYEFLGDYWHGNPNRYKLTDFNKSTNKTFETLYNDTFNRFNILKKYGYTIRYIWESDWNDYKNDTTENLKLMEYNMKEAI